MTGIDIDSKFVMDRRTYRTLLTLMSVEACLGYIEDGTGVIDTIREARAEIERLAGISLDDFRHRQCLDFIWKREGDDRTAIINERDEMTENE